MSLKFAILGLLSIRPMSGYEVKKSLDRPMGYTWHASESQIYPELRKMEEMDLVKGHIIHQVMKPDKKVYNMTDKGGVLLDEWLLRPTKNKQRKDEFLLKLFFFHRIDTPSILRHLEQERLGTEEILKYGKAQIYKYRKVNRSRKANVLKWQLSCADAAVRELETHKEWLEEVIADFRNELGNHEISEEVNASLKNIYPPKSE